MDNNKPTNWKKTLKWLPGVVISLVAVYAISRFISPEGFQTAFRTINIKFFILIFLLNILVLIVRGKAWQTILGEKFTYKQAFFGVSEGYFLNNILPLRAGEIGRSFFVGRNSGKGMFYVLSTIVIERAFDIAYAAALVVLTLPYINGMAWIKPIALLALALVIVALIFLFFIARNKEKVLSWVNSITKPPKLIKFILPKTQGVIEGFSSLAKPSQFLLSLFWIGVNWAIWAACYYFAVAAIITDAPLWYGAFVAGVLALGVAIPSAPSALGVLEATFVGAITILGGQSDKALAYAIVLHMAQFLSVAIFGIWGLFREGLSFSQIITTVSGNNDNLMESDAENKSK